MPILNRSDNEADDNDMKDLISSLSQTNNTSVVCLFCGEFSHSKELCTAGPRQVLGWSEIQLWHPSLLAFNINQLCVQAWILEDLDNILVDFNEKAHRGRQMLSYGSKSRTATDSGYFSRFERVFHGEDDSNPQQRYLQEKMNYRKQCIGRPFYFTLPKQIPPPAFYSRFQPASRKMADNILRPPFRYPNPPKKGTGSGYGVVTIGKYPSAVTVQKEETKVHKTEAQSSDLPFYPPKSGKYFDGNPYRGYMKSKTGLSTSPKKHIGYIRPWLNPGKGKKLGYMKDGCFTPFSHFGNQGLQRPVEDKRSPIGLEVTPNFICSIAPKSTATPSIIQKKIKRSVNAVTYKTITFI